MSTDHKAGIVRHNLDGRKPNSSYCTCAYTDEDRQRAMRLLYADPVSESWSLARLRQRALVVMMKSPPGSHRHHRHDLAV